MAVHALPLGMLGLSESPKSVDAAVSSDHYKSSAGLPKHTAKSSHVGELQLACCQRFLSVLSLTRTDMFVPQVQYAQDTREAPPKTLSTALTC